MRWNRYEVIISLNDGAFRTRVRYYPTRWLATWAAARRIQRSLTAPGMNAITYEVREIAPKSTPSHWRELSVLQTPHRYSLPLASVTAGSTVVHTSIGMTRWHALGRACKWAKPRSRELVRVSRWSGERSYVPDEQNETSVTKSTSRIDTKDCKE